jgi:hypothetical protein
MKTIKPSSTLGSELYKNNSVSYIEDLTELAFMQITKYMEGKTDTFLIHEHFAKRIEKKQFSNFQAYYFRTINKRNLFHATENFFREFKSNYSLQGVDDYFLKHLETNKEKIINLIDEGKLSEVYFTYFFKVKIGSVQKDFGSFFTKLIHHFIPHSYCQVDIPMRIYFKLTHESYFVAFIVISGAFKKWAKKNSIRIERMKKLLAAIVKKNQWECEHITDMKILNIIFWSDANPIKI